jgi:PAS domain S-box-containing protein
MFISIFISRSITRPLRKLHEGTEEVTKGNLNFKVGTPSPDEVGQLSRAFDEMTTKLKKSREELEEYSKNLEKKVEERTRDLEIDLNKRRKIEEALSKSQQEFDSLFRNSPEALAYLDEKAIILDANFRFCELFGYTLDEIKGRDIKDGMIHPPDRMEEGEKIAIKGLEEGYLNYETIRKKKDGTLFPVSRKNRGRFFV